MNKEKMQQLFKVSHELRALQETYEQFLHEIGLEGEYSRAGYDWYDSSFDLKDCDPTLELSEDQLDRLWEIGFTDGWLHSHPGHDMGYKHYHKPRK